jgi:hypothetical protein
MTGDGLCLDQSLVERLHEFAGREGLQSQEALEVALGLGLDLAAGGAGRREAALAALAGSVEDLMAAATLLGPPLLAVLRLLVTWAAREGFGVSEDELMAEILSAAAAEWELRLAEAGILAAQPKPEP